MSDTVFGIYGFDFSKQFTVLQAKVVPCHGFPKCQSLAQDRTHLFLTGYGILPENRASADIDQSDFVRRLADGMTFCQLADGHFHKADTNICRRFDCTHDHFGRPAGKSTDPQ